MYKLISAISLFVRQFCLPNPFECFGTSAALINWIAGFVMAPITYLIVGYIYEKGSAPVLGSLLYLLTYALFTMLLWIMGLFSFAWWWVLILIIAIAGIILEIKKLCENKM